jgi:hypothetical protein
VVDELLDELGDVGAGGPLGGQVADLLLGRDLAGQEQPEEALKEPRQLQALQSSVIGTPLN